MNRIAGVVIAAVLMGTAMGARAAELSDQDRAELRQRAQEFNNQRSRDPDFQPGHGRAQPGDASVKPTARAGKSKRPKSAG